MAGAVHVVGDDGQQIRPRRLSGSDRQQDSLDRSARRRHHRDDEEARRRRHVQQNFNSIDFAPAQVPWTQGKAALLVQGIVHSRQFPRRQSAVLRRFRSTWFPIPAMSDKKPVMSIYDEDTMMIHAAEQEQGRGGRVRQLDGIPEASAKKLEIDKPYRLERLRPICRTCRRMEQRLGKAMCDAGSYTFMHVDHGTPPAISDRFLDAVQGVLAGAMSPEEAMQATEDARLSACAARSRRVVALMSSTTFGVAAWPSDAVSTARGAFWRPDHSKMFDCSLSAVKSTWRFPENERRTNVVRRIRAKARLRDDLRPRRSGGSVPLLYRLPDRLHDLSELLRMERHGAGQEVRRSRQLRLHARRQVFLYLAVKQLKWLGRRSGVPGDVWAFSSPTRCGCARSISRRFLRTAIFFPVTMSLVAVGLMFLLILNPIFGAFDSVLRSLGLGFLVREWFGDYRIAIYTLAVVVGMGVHRPADDLLFRRDRRCAEGDVRRGADRGRRPFAHDAAGRLAAAAPGHCRGRHADAFRVVEGLRSRRGA